MRIPRSKFTACASCRLTLVCTEQDGRFLCFRCDESLDESLVGSVVELESVVGEVDLPGPRT